MVGEKKLNKEQLQAVKHKNGPLMIIAGAGTGKTTVITERVKYIIEKKLANPSEILALTFTEKAAQEMQERIDVALPLGYTQMWISTFHAFCDRVLKNEALHIGLSPNYKLNTQAESIQFFRKNLFKFELDYFRPLGNPTKFIDGMIQHFSRLQDEDINPIDYINWVNSKFQITVDIRRGINPYTVNYMQTLGPPSVLSYFLPFSLFNFQVAKFLYTFVSVASGFLICCQLNKILFKRCDINWFLFFSLLLFSSFPTRFSIEMGQPNLVIGYLISLLMYYQKSKFTGIFLGSIILIKTNFLLVIFSILNNKKLLKKTLVTVFSFILLLSPIIKPSYYLYYLLHKSENFLPTTVKTEDLSYYNQSLPTRLSILGLGNLSSLIYYVAVILIVYIVIKFKNIFLGILSSVILSPISWQHYFAALFPIYIYAIVKSRNIKTLIFSLFAYLLCWIEFPGLHFGKINLATSLLASHFLVSAIILFICFWNSTKTHTSSLKMM